MTGTEILAMCIGVVVGVILTIGGSRLFNEFTGRDVTKGWDDQ